MLGGIGSAVGGLFKAVAKIGVGFAVGMGALGAGIAAFILALGAADTLAGFMGSGENLKVLIQNFFGAFDEKAVLMMGGLIGLSILASKMKVGAVQMAAGMTGIGAGIAGFFGGILIADGLAKLGEYAKLDGSSIANLISNFVSAFEPHGATGIAVLTAILGVGALTSLNPADSFKGALKNGVQIAAGMAGLGLGVAGFFAGILAADGLAQLGSMIGLDGKGLATLLNNFLGAFTAHGATGIGVLTAIMGVGALNALVSPGKNIAESIKNAMSIASGMTGLGLGISGFFLGILAGDGLAKLGSMISLDGKSLATLIDNFVGAFAKHGATGVTALVSILGVGALVGLVGSIPGVGAAAVVQASLGIMAGMTALGMGIAGFTLGIIAGDGAAKLGQMAGLDGKSLGKLISNFIDAFAGDKKRMVVLTGLLGVAALGAFNPTAGPGIAAALTGLGAGIAGFVGGFLLGDLAAKLGDFLGLDGTSLGNLLGNIGVGIGKFLGGIGKGAIAVLKDLDADRVGKLGKGIADLGAGILSFAVGSAAGGAANAIGGAIDSVMSLFGGSGTKSPIEQIADISRDDSINTDRLKDLGLGIFHLGKGLEAFSGADAEKIETNLKALEGFGRLSNEDKQLVQSMNMNVMSGAMVGGGEGAGTIINNDNRTITIQNAPQLTNITGLEFARPQTGKVGT